MQSSVRVADAASVKADHCVIAVAELGERVPRDLRPIDAATDKALGRAVRGGDFEGKRDQSITFHPASGPARVTLVGMGPAKAVTAGSIRRAVAIGTRAAVKTGAANISVATPGAFRRRVDAREFGKAAMEGVGQGAWFFDDLRSIKENKGPVRRATVLCGEEERGAVNRGRLIGAAITEGHILTRDLQMLPGNHCTPSRLATEARAIGRRHGFKVTVLRKAQMEKEGLNALLAVSQGSAEEPRFITMEYKGAGNAAPVCLVGKGVTFDSGGISLKPGQAMEEMKFDMSAAAAVLGTFEALGRIKPRINVVGVIPATENLPSSTAVKPGDVITTHLGKTVEIINTDAEGRLILGDALSYARRFKPSCMVDAATLTGSVIVGLGHFATGAMGNNDKLVKELCDAGEAADERCWPLPLWDVYRPLIKSKVADIQNVGGRAAGSITAGWFLREFVEDEMPWVHLDIAGTAWGDGDAAMAPGPTGVGVRLFTEFLLRRAG
jgi:leucyl aminopeptidase